MNCATGDQTFMRTSAGGALAADSLAEGARLGAWAVESPIAAGGMGQVYRARRADGAYDQTVAIKLIHDRAPERVARFTAERQRLAEMDHPGIARIIDGGTHDDGRPWMAMELVEGAPIMPQAMGLSRDARLRLFIDLCAAVSHAHGRLVLHRDLKSANVLLDAKGAVRLIDFGISALAEGEAAPGAAYTPATAAPEQLHGQAPSVRTDVFALGCLLHELLTGAVPKRDEAGGTLLDRTGIGDQDLEAIVGQATSFLPEDRYSSAQALADDVAAALEHRPVGARHGGAAYRAGKFVRRAPVATGLAAAFVAALVGGILVSLNYARQAAAEADKAQAELARAEYQLERTNGYSYGMLAANDLLQRSFAIDADAHKAVLLARWREVMAGREAAPDIAAGMSFSLGRVLADRNDFATAAAVLEEWLAGDFGPPILVEAGRRMLAGILPRVGREADAIPLLRQIEADFAAGPGADSFDRVSSVVKLGQASLEPDDIALGKQVARAYLAANPRDSAQIRFFIHHQLSQLAQRRGDFETALAEQRKAADLALTGADATAQGRHIVLMGLADLELFAAQSPSAARAIAAQVIDESRTLGESADTVRAIAMLGIIAGQAGDRNAAASQLRQAFAAIAGKAGPASEDYTRIGASLAEALADAGQLAAAERQLADVRAAIGPQPEAGMRAVRLALAQARVDAAAGRAPDCSGMPARTIAAYPYLAARYAALPCGQGRS